MFIFENVLKNVSISDRNEYLKELSILMIPTLLDIEVFNQLQTNFVNEHISKFWIIKTKINH